MCSCIHERLQQAGAVQQEQAGAQGCLPVVWGRGRGGLAAAKAAAVRGELGTFLLTGALPSMLCAAAAKLRSVTLLASRAF